MFSAEPDGTSFNITVENDARCKPGIKGLHFLSIFNSMVNRRQLFFLMRKQNGVVIISSRQ